MRIYVMAGIIGLLAACQADEVTYKYPEMVKGRYEMPFVDEQQATLFSKSFLTVELGGKKEQGTAEDKVDVATSDDIKEKAPPADLWPFVLPVLSVYPIDMMRDDFISTEWFSDESDVNRQLKINAVDMGEGVKITVLCREKDKNGAWINQKNDATLADKIKNDIVMQSMNR